MTIRVFIAEPADAPRFATLHDDVFDGPVDPGLLDRYLAADHLQIALATDGDLIIGMCSGVIHHHPDKPEHWWINELGVAEPWRRQGIATRLVAASVNEARRRACREIWVVADPTEMAEGFWQSLGWTRTGDRLAMFSRDL
jgi:ribosomal protein S18 acetylase RimI-like enzyme